MKKKLLFTTLTGGALALAISTPLVATSCSNTKGITFHGVKDIKIGETMNFTIKLDGKDPIAVDNTNPSTFKKGNVFMFAPWTHTSIFKDGESEAILRAYVEINSTNFKDWTIESDEESGTAGTHTPGKYIAKIILVVLNKDLTDLSQLVDTENFDQVEGSFAFNILPKA